MKFIILSCFLLPPSLSGLLIYCIASSNMCRNHGINIIGCANGSHLREARNENTCKPDNTRSITPPRRVSLKHFFGPTKAHRLYFGPLAVSVRYLKLCHRSTSQWRRCLKVISSFIFAMNVKKKLRNSTSNQPGRSDLGFAVDHYDTFIRETYTRVVFCPR